MKSLELASSLRSIVSTMSKRLRKSVQSADSFSMTDLNTMSHLYPDQVLSTSDLAYLVMVKPQSMSEVIGRLEKLSIIQRNTSNVDKRKSLVNLTEKGKEFVEQTRYERDEWLADAIEKTLSAEEMRIIQQAIGLIEKLAEHK